MFKNIVKYNINITICRSLVTTCFIVYVYMCGVGLSINREKISMFETLTQIRKKLTI